MPTRLIRTSQLSPSDPFSPPSSWMTCEGRVWVEKVDNIISPLHRVLSEKTVILKWLNQLECIMWWNHLIKLNYLQFSKQRLSFDRKCFTCKHARIIMQIEMISDDAKRWRCVSSYDCNPHREQINDFNIASESFIGRFPTRHSLPSAHGLILVTPIWISDGKQYFARTDI